MKSRIAMSIACWHVVAYEVRLLESQNMSQGQATGFSWQFIDSDGTNAMLNTQYSSCNTADAITVSAAPVRVSFWQ
jgi:hypothetical protein